VLEAVEVDTLASSLPAGHALNALTTSALRCRRGLSWEWDGVRFEMLHPADATARPARRNDLSCVLRVASAGGSMLLTGDIERASETALLQAAKGVKNDVLLVPHHGSRTSSTTDFIAAVGPRWAVVPTGYRNRFGHPHRDVLERYRFAGAEILRTDLHGAVSVTLGARHVEVQAERHRRQRYWLQ
jgi:competence protein ComEC